MTFQEYQSQIIDPTLSQIGDTFRARGLEATFRSEFGDISTLSVERGDGDFISYFSITYMKYGDEEPRVCFDVSRKSDHGHKGNRFATGTDLTSEFIRSLAAQLTSQAGL